jgi:hypothetical protein
MISFQPCDYWEWIEGKWVINYGIAGNPIAGYAIVGNLVAGYALPAVPLLSTVDILSNTRN